MEQCKEQPEKSSQFRYGGEEGGSIQSSGYEGIKQVLLLLGVVAKAVATAVPLQ